MTEPILVHKCWLNQIDHIYFKKESALHCDKCKYIHNAISLNLYLQEELVDQMNEYIFGPHRFLLEVENNVKNFFDPPNKMLLIDKSLRSYKEYKTSWKEKD